MKKCMPSGAVIFTKFALNPLACLSSLDVILVHQHLQFDLLCFIIQLMMLWLISIFHGGFLNRFFEFSLKELLSGELLLILCFFFLLLLVRFYETLIIFFFRWTTLLESVTPQAKDLTNVGLEFSVIETLS